MSIHGFNLKRCYSTCKRQWQQCFPTCQLSPKTSYLKWCVQSRRLPPKTVSHTQLVIGKVWSTCEINLSVRNSAYYSVSNFSVQQWFLCVIKGALAEWQISLIYLQMRTKGLAARHYLLNNPQMGQRVSRNQIYFSQSCCSETWR